MAKHAFLFYLLISHYLLHTYQVLREHVSLRIIIIMTFLQFDVLGVFSYIKI